MITYTNIEKIDRAGLSRTTLNNNFLFLETKIVEEITGRDWKESILTISDEASAVEVSGNRYIADSDGSTWVKDYIYEWGLPVGGSSSVSFEWLEIIPNEGTACLIEDIDEVYIYNGITWVSLYNPLIHNDLSGINGGTNNERYHFTNSELTALTQNGDAQSLHYHDTKVSPPVNNTSIGVKGQWAIDSNYYYTCISTNVWIREVVETTFPPPSR